MAMIPTGRTICIRIGTGLICAVGSCFLGCAPAPPPPAASANEWSARVVGISDGDTITVLKGPRQQVKLRLFGIDCPESAQAFGSRAKQLTSELAAGKIVKVIVKDRDRYGRTVAEVMLPDGRSLNRELVRAGLAWHYVEFARHDKELAELEREARLAKRGLWSERHPIPPWDYRAQIRAAEHKR
jgi:micrococcal nuclease